MANSQKTSAIILKSALYYFLAFFSLLPGFVVGPWIILFWYIAAAIIFFQNKTVALINVFIIWIFIRDGMYRYSFLGDNQSFFLFQYFDEFLIVLLILCYLRNKKEKNENITKYIIYSIPLLLLNLISAVLNKVSALNIINYFTSTFRWVILFYIIGNIKIEKSELKKTVILLFVIVGINSIIGFLQQTIIPDIRTPNGYLPDKLDVASGLLGTASSQILTALCLGFSYLFLFRYMAGIGKKNLLFIIILFAQPFISSSKATLIFLFVIMVISFILYTFYLKIKTLQLKTILKYISIIIILFIGIKIYDITNAKDFGRKSNYFEYYLGKKQSIQDFRKVQGYFEATSLVAPRGRGGIWLGVGPTNFTSEVGIKNKAPLIAQMGLDQENLISSVDMKTTDFTGLIGETGILGSLLFLMYMFYLYFSTLRRSAKRTSTKSKIFTFFIAQWIAVMILFSFYDRGWLLFFYYIPLIIFLIYDLKFNNDINTVEPCKN